MDFKQCNFELKSITQDSRYYYFEGWASKYGELDDGGDIVVKGAFSRTIKNRGGTVKMLWNHNVDYPIGRWDLEDRKEGLYVKGRLIKGIAKAEEVYLMLKEKLVDQLSIGYAALKKSYKDGARLLEEIKLYEVSPVTFAMLESATITDVKAGRMLSQANIDRLMSVLTRLQTLAVDDTIPSSQRTEIITTMGDLQSLLAIAGGTAKPADAQTPEAGAEGTEASDSSEGEPDATATADASAPAAADASASGEAPPPAATTADAGKAAEEDEVKSILALMHLRMQMQTFTI